MTYPLPKKLLTTVRGSIPDTRWVALLAIGVLTAFGSGPSVTSAQTTAQTTGWTTRPSKPINSSSPRSYHRGTLRWQSPANRSAPGQETPWTEAAPLDSRANRQAMLFHATPRPTVQATSHVGAKADNAPVDPFSDPFGDRRAEKQTPFANAAKARQNAERPLFKLTEWESESSPNSSEATIQRTNWNTSASDAIERTAPPQRLNNWFQRHDKPTGPVVTAPCQPLHQPGWTKQPATNPHSTANGGVARVQHGNLGRSHAPHGPCFRIAYRHATHVATTHTDPQCDGAKTTNGIRRNAPRPPNRAQRRSPAQDHSTGFGSSSRRPASERRALSDPTTSVSKRT